MNNTHGPLGSTPPLPSPAFISETLEILPHQPGDNQPIVRLSEPLGGIGRTPGDELHTPGQSTSLPCRVGGLEPWEGAEPCTSTVPRFLELFSSSPLAALDPVIAAHRDISVLSKQNKEGHPRATSHRRLGHAGAPLKASAEGRMLLQGATNEWPVLWSAASKINTWSIPRLSFHFFFFFILSPSVLVSQTPVSSTAGRVGDTEGRMGDIEGRVIMVGLMLGLRGKGNPTGPAHCKGSEGWELSQPCSFPPTWGQSKLYLRKNKVEKNPVGWMEVSPRRGILE